MIALDEIHTVTVTENGQHAMSFEARLNDDDTVSGMRERVITEMGGDEIEIGSAFDAAFEACEAVPGDGAVGYRRFGAYAIEIRRDIGE